ncbi:acyl-activating enzyme 14 isoform X2 [Wolffia australiana]
MAEEHSRGHIGQCLSRILARRGDAAAFVSLESGAARTGAEFVNGVLSLSRAISSLGIGKGHVVAIAAFNSDWFLEWILALTLVGGIPAPLNYRWSKEEAREAVAGVEPVALVVDEGCRRWASELGDGSVTSLQWCFLMGEAPRCLYGPDSGLEQYVLREPMDDPTIHYIWAPEDIALICFTSGTTGRPKGVALSHMSLIIQSYAKIAIVGYTEDDIYLHTAPLCHIGGISSAIALLMVGGCHVFQPKFDARLTLQSIEEFQVTSLITVPTMISSLASLMRKEDEWAGGKSVIKVLNGGGSLSHDLISAAVLMFPRAKLISAYGMTEACSSLTFTTLHDPSSPLVETTSSEKVQGTPGFGPHEFKGICVGMPPIHVELCIEGNIARSSCPVVGRILSRGPHLMVRYWSSDKVKAPNWVKGGWLDTGEIGWIDGNGQLWLVGRNNSRIKSGGENVYPEELGALS